MNITLFKEKSFSILMSITDIGESGSKKSVLDNINSKGYLNFSSTDLEVKQNRNELHWRNDLAFIRKKLVIEKYVDDSQKNNWKITEKGKQYLISLCEEIVNIDTKEINKLSNLAVKKAINFLASFENNNIQEFFNSNEFISAFLSKTDKEALIKIRIGQGIFKKKLLNDSKECKICKLTKQDLLIASHIKPWKDSNNIERLDKNNGFLLCPTHDALFDKGYITFDDEGQIILSSQMKKDEYKILNIEDTVKININNENKKYLKWHRENIFKI